MIAKIKQSCTACDDGTCRCEHRIDCKVGPRKGSLEDCEVGVLTYNLTPTHAVLLPASTSTLARSACPMKALDRSRGAAETPACSLTTQKPRNKIFSTFSSSLMCEKVPSMGFPVHPAPPDGFLQAGASLQYIKVEIGGDAQSTEGVEQTHARVRGDLNCTRGYEWWILSEARKRNPAIKTYGLSWVRRSEGSLTGETGICRCAIVQGAPGWIGDGNYYSSDNLKCEMGAMRVMTAAVVMITSLFPPLLQTTSTGCTVHSPSGACPSSE